MINIFHFGHDKCSDNRSVLTMSPVEMARTRNVQYVLFIFIWGFMSLSTLYRSYHGGLLEGQRKPVPTVGKVLYCKLPQIE